MSGSAKGVVCASPLDYQIQRNRVALKRGDFDALRPRSLQACVVSSPRRIVMMMVVMALWLLLILLLCLAFLHPGKLLLRHIW